MKLPLRHFILACLLLGAIGVPWTWRTYQAKRAEVIVELEKELEALWEQHSLRAHWRDHFLGDETPEEIRARLNRIRKRIELLQDRLEKLTGVRPTRPEYEPAPATGQVLEL